MVSIRPIRESDAPAFLELQRRLDTETSFMLLEPEERTTTIEEQRARIRGVVESECQELLVAEDVGGLVGFIVARGGDYRRNRHRAHLVMGVQRSHWRLGIGTALLERIEAWARQEQLRRLELTVMVDNERAILLYRKQGFVTEGTQRESLLIDGCAIDEHMMAKLLPIGGAAEQGAAADGPKGRS